MKGCVKCIHKNILRFWPTFRTATSDISHFLSICRVKYQIIGSKIKWQLTLLWFTSNWSHFMLRHKIHIHSFYQVNINKNFLCRIRMTSPHRRYISHLHLHMSTLKVTLTSTRPGMSFIWSALNGYYISFCTLFIYLCYISIPLMCLLIKILKYCLKCLLVYF